MPRKRVRKPESEKTSPVSISLTNAQHEYIEALQEKKESEDFDTWSYSKVIRMMLEYYIKDHPLDKNDAEEEDYDL